MDRYCNKQMNCTGYAKIQSGNETLLQQCVANVGPIRYNIAIAI